MPPVGHVILLWLIAWSSVAAVLTVYDKRAAVRRPRHRVRERSLFTVAALGGAAVMLVTMLLIRHKTRHVKFMVGLPLLILLHTALLAVVIAVGWV